MKKAYKLIRLQVQNPDEDCSFHLTTGLVVWWMGEATSLISPPCAIPICCGDVGQTWLRGL